jgi:hypothetical protein
MSQSTDNISGTPQEGNDDAPANYMGISSGTFSSNLAQENTLIMKHYFGKMKQFRSFLQDGEKVVQE